MFKIPTAEERAALQKEKEKKLKDLENERIGRNLSKITENINSASSSEVSTHINPVTPKPLSTPPTISSASTSTITNVSLVAITVPTATSNFNPFNSTKPTSTSATASSTNVNQTTSATNLTARQLSSNKILINPCQKGNKLLEHIRNVRCEFSDIVPDFEVGFTSCILYLSLKYHRLHPEYIFTRMNQLANRYVLRVILILADIDNPQHAIREITRPSIYNNFAVVIAWNIEEAGKYIETFKAFENKPPDMIKERVDSSYLSKANDFLTQVKSVNKTDVLTLLSNFGSIQSIMNASADEIAMCPGLGQQKVRRLQEAFDQPFALQKI
ncbi:ssDNA endonuclease and repair protein rad10 [Nowakowskiella sp. JEL0407]|nr:ssDNA endonuclease and repair protein rad10 [Nowakowskiella sp. JEL0407]